MGSCFSSSSIAASSSTADRLPTAKVIHADGLLIDYSRPVKVSHVLGLNHHTFFLCNADELFYGHHIQALDDNYLIELGKLYFFLPVTKLNHPLTAEGMAALAVCANSAIADTDLMNLKNISTGRKMRMKGVQVMPVITVKESDGYERFYESNVGSWKIERGGKKNGEVKQTASRRGESAVKRPFRPRLSYIEEVYE